MLRAIQEVPGLFISNNNHAPYASLSPERAALPTYAIVRNPWDWYVSMYFYLQYVINNRLQDFALPFQKLDRKHQDLVELYTQPFDVVMLVKNSARRELHDQLLNLTYRDDGLHNKIQWLRFEDGARTSFHRMLSDCGVTIPERSRLRIEEKAPINTSPRLQQYQSYYTPETRKVVETLEAETIRRFNYQF